MKNACNYYYSLVFEDGYLIDGRFKDLQELNELVLDVIEDSNENGNDRFVLTITKL